MVAGSAKKSPAKSDRTPTRARRSASKTLKEGNSPAASIGSKASNKSPVKTTSKKKSPRDASFSHRLPTNQQRRGNGRVSGRSLIMWNRPRMAEKLLLQIHYECWRHKIQLPWDAIAHRLHPGSSGAAVLQHLMRLRRDLISEGHLVPPMPNKPGAGSTLDPEIRGYIRKYPEGRDRTTTRPVMFDESIDDLKFNLPDAFDEDEEDMDEDKVKEGEEECDEESAADDDDGEAEEDTDVPDTPTPIRPIDRGVASTARGYRKRAFQVENETAEEANEYEPRPGDYYTSFSSVSSADNNDLHPDSRAWAPVTEPYQFGHMLGVEPSSQHRHHDFRGHSPFNSQGFQPAHGMSASMFGYHHPGSYMHMPMGMPSFFPYHPMEGYAAVPQRQERDGGFVKPVESPEIETKLEPSSEEDLDFPVTPIDDVLVRGV